MSRASRIAGLLVAGVALCGAVACTRMEPEPAPTPPATTSSIGAAADPIPVLPERPRPSMVGRPAVAGPAARPLTSVQIVDSKIEASPTPVGPPAEPAPSQAGVADPP